MKSKTQAAYDCHAHIGEDEDGHKLTAEQLLEQMDASNVEKAVVFPLNTPNDNKTFTKSNNIIHEAYNAHPGRFIPFFRLNPHFGWEKEFDRCLKLGFKGIKLHPRSQNFSISSPEGIYRLAEKKNLVVLLHAGRGVENAADEISAVVKKFPQLKLIIGHSGFVDLDNVIKKLGKCTNILFDTSACKKEHLLELVKRVSPEKIVFGSDAPYHTIGAALESVSEALAILKKTCHLKSILKDNLRGFF